MKNMEIEDLYKSIFNRYYPNLLFYATRFLSEEEAQDVVQDVFVDLWKRRESIEMGDQIQAFLYRSVYTRAINILKHKRVIENYSQAFTEFYNRKIEFYDPSRDNDIIARLENRELGNEMITAINELPDKCKEVFKMSYFHDMKNKDIANVMDISLRTVEAHMYKALKYLRRRLCHLIALMIFIFLY